MRRRRNIAGARRGGGWTWAPVIDDDEKIGGVDHAIVVEVGGGWRLAQINAPALGVAGGIGAGARDNAAVGGDAARFGELPTCEVEAQASENDIEIAQAVLVIPDECATR